MQLKDVEKDFCPDELRGGPSFDTFSAAREPKIFPKKFPAAERSKSRAAREPKSTAAREPPRKRVLVVVFVDVLHPFSPFDVLNPFHPFDVWNPLHPFDAVDVRFGAYLLGLLILMTLVFSM